MLIVTDSVSSSLKNRLYVSEYRDFQWKCCSGWFTSHKHVRPLAWAENDRRLSKMTSKILGFSTVRMMMSHNFYVEVDMHFAVPVGEGVKIFVCCYKLLRCRQRRRWVPHPSGLGHWWDIEFQEECWKYYPSAACDTWMMYCKQTFYRPPAGNLRVILSICLAPLCR